MRRPIYKVVNGVDQQQLERKVNAEIRTGYWPKGGILITNAPVGPTSDKFHQAMVLRRKLEMGSD